MESSDIEFPHEILGIEEGAGKEDIKKAYRKKAFELHPDRHEGDEEMKRRFVEASAAYNFLSAEAEEKPKRVRAEKPGHIHGWAAHYSNLFTNWGRINSEGGEFETSGDWTVKDLEEKILEVFVQRGINRYIIISSRREAFGIDAVSYWSNLGLLEVKGSYEGEQSGSIHYGLTDAGIEFVEESLERKRIGTRS